MKTRTNFVSNSSSSSFIVAFPKVPESAEEMQEILFGTAQDLENPDWDSKYNPSVDRSFPVSQVAQIVFDDIEAPLTEDNIFEEMRHTFDSGVKWEDHKKEDETYDFEAIDKAEAGKAEELLRPEVKEFIGSHKGATFLKFEYSDNDGALYSSMEHGDLFRRLPYLQISHH